MDIEERCPLKVLDRNHSFLVHLLQTDLYLNPMIPFGQLFIHFHKVCNELRYKPYYFFLLQ